MASWMVGGSNCQGQAKNVVSDERESPSGDAGRSCLHVGDQMELARPVDLLAGMRVRFSKFDATGLEPLEEVTVHNQGWFRWGSTRWPGGPGRVELLDGSSLAGQWHSVDERGIEWESAIWGKLTIPRELVQGVYRGSVMIGSLSHESGREAVRKDSSEAQLLLSDGSRFPGRWDRQGQFPREVKDRFPWIGESGPLSIPWGKVIGIEYGGMKVVEPDVGMRIVLDQGDCLSVVGWSLGEDGAIEMNLGVPYSIRTSMGSQALARRVVGVSGLASFSPAVRELRRERPVAYRHMPLQRGQFPLRGGDEAGEGPIVIDGVHCEDAISIPSPGQAAFKHDGRTAWFCTELIGRSKRANPSRLDGEGKGETLIAKVMVSRGGNLEVAWTDRIALDGVARRIVRLPMEGVRLVVLIHERASEYDMPNELYWVNPRIVVATE